MGPEVYEMWGERLSKKRAHNHKYKVRSYHDYFFRIKKNKYYRALQIWKVKFRNQKLPNSTNTTKYQKDKINAFINCLTCLYEAFFLTLLWLCTHWLPCCIEPWHSYPNDLFFSRRSSFLIGALHSPDRFTALVRFCRPSHLRPPDSIRQDAAVTLKSHLMYWNV